MLKVGIVGCGKIADSHAAQIRRIRDCEIAWACDREPLMARQLFERFRIGRHGHDLTRLLEEAKPDVVHITTPPASHFPIAAQCLEAGCHVYVEKPFTLDAGEARMLFSMAKARGLKITSGHDDQFSHAARRMRELVKSGYIGEGPVHMESTYCYEMARTGYAGALLGDKKHWVRQLPGKLLHNIISHGIAKIAEFLTTDTPHVQVLGFPSPMLREMGETEIIDELRVIIWENTGVTAYFTFSSQMRPGIHEFRIFGARNGLILDQNSESLIRLRGKRYTSYVEKIVPQMSYAAQYIGNIKANVRSFLANEFHMKSGMKFLIESFYRSIDSQGEDPIPEREILLVATIMDLIFAQLNEGHAVNASNPESLAL